MGAPSLPAPPSSLAGIQQYLLEIKQVLDFHALTGADKKAVTDLSKPGPIGTGEPAIMNAVALLLKGKPSAPFSGFNGWLYAGDLLWTEIGSGGPWGTISFQNSWVNFGSGNATAAFRRMSDGTVQLKGLIKSGTVGTVPAFTLPAGCRPAQKLHFMGVNPGGGSLANLGVSIGVNTTGEVQIETAANNNSASLSGVRFLAEA